MSVESPTIRPYGRNNDVDPLGAAHTLAWLPEFIADRNPSYLIQAARGLAPDVPVHELPGVWERGAALGSIGDGDMVFSALRRRFNEPYRLAPEFALALDGLADIATHYEGAPKGIPRATVDTYWDPRISPRTGRRAAFRGIESEYSFMDEIGTSYKVTREAAAIMADIDLFGQTDDEIAARLDAATKRIWEMFDSTIRVMKVYGKEEKNGLGPFAEIHQPFFKKFSGIDASSAAQMPSKEVEWLARGLGASTGVNGSAYALGRFYLPNIAYTPAARLAEVEKFGRTNGNVSIFQYLLSLPQGSTRRQKLGEAYVGLAQAFASFGSGHNAGVERDFENRSEGARGGGGYGTDDLRLLLDERREHLKLAETLFSTGRGYDRSHGGSGRGTAPRTSGQTH